MHTSSHEDREDGLPKLYRLDIDADGTAYEVGDGNCGAA